ncbi:YhdP family protein [Nevskia sp.]|uniref:YhdP family protein n=1 Tax=Nevskia sp. TaxID=1929292 RepID=UPI0025E4D6DE|nr:YhdP family protein [Nevskia sp.]
MKLVAKRWWTRLITVLAVLLITVATISLGFRLLIDAVPGYRGDVERFVTASVGHPTRIGTMALTWRGLSPTLELRDLALLDDSGAALLKAPKLRLGLSLGRLIAGPRVPDRIEAEGLQLVAHADADGHLTLDGVTLKDTGNHALVDDLARYTELRLRNCSLRLLDVRLADAAPLDFVLDEAQLRHGNSGYALNAVLRPPAELARRARLTALITGDPGQLDTLAGDWTLKVEDVAGWPWLKPALKPGVQIALDDAQLSAEGRIEAGKLGVMQFIAQAREVIARTEDAPLARIAAIDVDARVEPVPDGWRLSLSKADLSGTRGPWSLAGLEAVQAADGSKTLKLPLLRLDDIAPWLTAWRELPETMARLRDAEGDLQALSVTLGPRLEDQPGALAVQAKLVGVGLISRAEQDGVSGIAGDLVVTRDSGEIRLAGTAVAVHLPRAFDQSLPLDALRGELHWQRSGEDWLLSAPAVDLVLGSAEVKGSVALNLHADRVPDLKLRLDVKADDVTALKPWMPKNWSEHNREWLDRAVREAKVTSGELLIDAPLTPRDADNHPTLRWELKVKVRDGVLAFAPDWPAAVAMAADLHFHDGGLDIDASEGRISDLTVTRLHAEIADFFVPALVLDGAFEGDAANLYRLLRDSPLKTRVSGLLTRTEASGPASATLALRMPLNIPQPPIDASGVLSLHDAELLVHGLQEPLRGLNGELDYGKSISAERLAARLYDTDVVAQISAVDAQPLLTAAFELEPGRGDGLSGTFIPVWLRNGLSGSTTMTVRLPLGGPDNGHLSLATDLQGVTSSLPTPLTKSAGSALPVAIDLSGDNGATRIGIRIADELHAGLRFVEASSNNGADSGGATRPHGIEVRLGSDPAMPRADAEGLVISGAPDYFDLGAWLALLGAPESGFGQASANGSSGPRFLSADIAAKQLSLRRLQLGATRLLALPDGDGVVVRTTGAAVGEVRWQPADGGSVVGRLEALALEPFPPLPPTVPGAVPPDSPFNPTRAPMFDLDIQRLSLGEVDLGHLNLVTARVDDGQRIERLSLAGGRLEAKVGGFWLRRALDGVDGSSADLNFDLHSNDIGDVLRVFGYTPNLVAETSHFSGAVIWPRVPAGLELSQATGTIDIDVHRGSLKAVEPGAGRVLGLVNLYALPRRLLFDFRDVVADGLGFDKLKGSFKLADGDAVTDNLNIDGPSLKVEMRGRIGLAARDYDQKVTVFPDISTGVTVGATLLGGPIAGGILLVAQQLFDKPFNQIGRFSYRVTGSWDDPTVLKAGEAPAAPPSAVPASAPAPTTTPADARNG